jgi:hypothetical protein
VVNLVLGVIGVVPLWMLGYLLRNTVLHDLAWSDRNPTENDGALPLVVVMGPPIVLFAGLWWAVNRWVRPRRHAGTWAVAVVLLVLPTAVLVAA